MKQNQDWKNEVFFDHYQNPEGITRDVARVHGVAWATMWDFKQRIVTGKLTLTTFLTKPKILLYDIETSPLLGHIWSLWNNNVSLNQLQEDWFMLSWSAKWLDEDKVFNDNLFRHKKAFKKDPQNDKIIIKSLFAMMDEADIVIGHNVKKFDNKKARARFLKHRLRLPSPYRSIDTLDIAKREFALASNKLDFLATFLGHPNKVSHEGHTLWTRCMQGQKDAWVIMQEYNDYDTVLLEKVYKDIRGYSSNPINLAVYYNDFTTRCPACASTDVRATNAKSHSNMGTFEVVKCADCGRQSKLRKTVTGKRKRDTLLGNIAP